MERRRSSLVRGRNCLRSRAVREKARRRWVIGITCTVAIIRMRNLCRAPLHTMEATIIRAMYLKQESITTSQDVCDLFSTLGIPCRQGHVADCLIRCGHCAGQVVTLQHLFDIVRVVKRAHQRESMIDDTQFVFAALGGGADLQGCVDANILRYLIRDVFKLTVDIEKFIEEHDDDGSGMLDFDEFKGVFAATSDAAGLGGGGGADAGAASTSGNPMLLLSTNPNVGGGGGGVSMSPSHRFRGDDDSYGSSFASTPEDTAAEEPVELLSPAEHGLRQLETMNFRGLNDSDKLFEDEEVARRRRKIQRMTARREAKKKRKALRTDATPQSSPKGATKPKNRRASSGSDAEDDGYGSTDFEAEEGAEEIVSPKSDASPKATHQDDTRADGDAEDEEEPVLWEAKRKNRRRSVAETAGFTAGAKRFSFDSKVTKIDKPKGPAHPQAIRDHRGNHPVPKSQRYHHVTQADILNLRGENKEPQTSRHVRYPKIKDESQLTFTPRPPPNPRKPAFDAAPMAASRQMAFFPPISPKCAAASPRHSTKSKKPNKFQKSKDGVGETGFNTEAERERRLRDVFKTEARKTSGSVKAQRGSGAATGMDHTTRRDSDDYDKKKMKKKRSKKSKKRRADAEMYIAAAETGNGVFFGGDPDHEGNRQQWETYNPFFHPDSKTAEMLAHVQYAEGHKVTNQC